MSKNYDKEKLIKMWNEGISVPKIAKELGVDKKQIWGYITTHRDKCPQKRCLYSKEKLRELWAQGMLISQIAKELNVSEYVIYNYVSTHRDECPRRREKIEYDSERLVELWNVGMSKREIAQILGIPASTVSGYTATHPDRCPRKRKKVNYDYDENVIIEMWNNGSSSLEISNKLGIPHTVVSGYIHTHRDECPNKRSMKMYEYDRDKLVKLWNAGKSISQIAEELNILESTVAGFVNSHRDRCIKKFERIIHDYDENLLIEMWNKGASLKEISIKLSIPKSTVAGFVRTHREVCPKRY